MSVPHVGIIIPPSPFLLDERVFPFLGPLKVAAALEHAHWPVEVLDLSKIKNFIDVVRDRVRSSRATVWGLTATTPQFPAAVEIARVIRAVRPKARLVIGGTHATLVVAARNFEMKNSRIGRAHRAYQALEAHFDTIVAGDGEESIFLACEEGAPRLIDGDGRKSPHREFFLDKVRLDAQALPARHLIDLDSYHYAIDGVRATSLIAQLGCPFECGFCAGRLSPMLRHIRTRSVGSIVAEITEIYKQFGYRGFMMYDDEINVSPAMLELMQQLTEAQRALGVEWRLRGFIKAELFSEEQARAMYEAGFRTILVGFESGSPRILENIKKRATRDENTRCIEIARRHGLKVKALMSFGHPGESPQTVEQTREWLLAVKPDDFDVSIITPYPGSPYYDQAVLVDGAYVYMVNGDRLFQEEVDYAKHADYYKGDPNDGYTSHVWTDYLSKSELVTYRNEVESDVRRLLKIPFNPSSASVLYEHSMGQTSIPSHILRTSAPFA